MGKEISAEDEQGSAGRVLSIHPHKIHHRVALAGILQDVYGLSNEE